MKPEKFKRNLDISPRANNAPRASLNVDELKNAKNVQFSGRPPERLNLVKRLGRFGRSVGIRVYLAAVFVFLVIIFIWLGFCWVKSGSNPKSIEENLKTDLLKNPVTSMPLSASQNAGASQGQVTKASQTAQNTAQTDASQSESSNSPINADDASTDVGATVPENNSTKKFESAALKVSFDYPKDVSVSEVGKIITMAKGDVFWKIRFYDNKNKKDFQAWYTEHFNIKTVADCAFTDATVKVGSYDSKLVKPSSDSAKCDGDGNYATSTDKSRVVKIELGKETAENVNKILVNFKFAE